MTQQANNGVLKVAEASAYTGLSVSTLNKLRLTGNGPAFIRLTSRAVGYLRSDLDAYLTSRRRQSTSDTGAAA